MNISFGSVVILVPLLVSLGVHLALGCYIIDCPLAGKRRDVNADVPLIRQYTDRQVGCIIIIIVIIIHVFYIRQLIGMQLQDCFREMPLNNC